MRLARDPQHVPDVEVGLDGPLAAADEIGLVRLGPVQRKAVLLRIDRDRADAEFGGGPHDADRDLAPIRDQQAANAFFPVSHETRL